jgi:hypothetical protein
MNSREKTILLVYRGSSRGTEGNTGGNNKGQLQKQREYLPISAPAVCERKRTKKQEGKLIFA